VSVRRGFDLGERTIELEVVGGRARDDVGVFCGRRIALDR
jgi:hypothetical protein